MKTPPANDRPCPPPCRARMPSWQATAPAGADTYALSWRKRWSSNALRLELFHLRLFGRMHTSRVRAAVKTAVEKLDACGVQAILRLSRRRAHQRERNFVPVGPPPAPPTSDSEESAGQHRLSVRGERSIYLDTLSTSRESRRTCK